MQTVFKSTINSSSDNSEPCWPILIHIKFFHWATLPLHPHFFSFHLCNYWDCPEVLLRNSHAVSPANVASIQHNVKYTPIPWRTREQLLPSEKTKAKIRSRTLEASEGENLMEKKISQGIFLRFHWVKTGSKNGREKKEPPSWLRLGNRKRGRSSNYQNRLEERAKNLEVTGCPWSFVQVSNDYRGTHILRTLTCSAKVLLSYIENPFK